MIKWKTVAIAMFFLVGLASTDAMAAGQKQGHMKDQVQKSDYIFGHQLMTSDERSEYRQKLQSLKTEQEREAYRMEHKKKIHKLAKAKGMLVPGNPSSPQGGMTGDKEGSGR